MENIVTVYIPKINKGFKASKGDRLIDVLWDNKIEIDSFCGGIKSCGKCLVKIIRGETTPIIENEKDILSQYQIENNIILACNHYILSDLEIEVLNSSKDIKDTKTFCKGNFDKKRMDPIVEKINIILDTPTMKDSRDDLKRVLEKLNRKIDFNPNIIRYISDVIRKEEYNVTTTIFDNRLIDIESGNTINNNYAVVIDLGTTTVAGYLVNMNKKAVIANYSFSNLQKKYGADVISRINYTLENKGGLQKMSTLAAESIDEIIKKLIEISKIDYKNIYLILTLGNTVMSHLLTNSNPKGIGRAPFTPVYTNLIKTVTKEIGISQTRDDCNFILLPNIGGYVGSDTVGVIISTDIDEMEGNWIAIDIGTNCELVLKSKDKLLTCSTAAGPAFEGACMSKGMRAESGAIYKFNIDDKNEDIKVNISTIGDVHPVGICGSGYIDIVSELLKLKVINKNGRLLSKDKISQDVNNELKNRIVKSDKGNKFILKYKDELHEEISITQHDISQLQLAKGAVRAGIEILLRHANIKEEDLDGILLAGAFGSNIDLGNAVVLGIIPNIGLEKIKAVGNAAGSGGIKAVLSKESLKKSEEIHSKVKHIELSVDKYFSSVFAKAMIFDI